MKVKRVAVGEYATNCYIIISADEKSVMLIDPSFDIPRIEHFVGDKQVTDIVLTHAHIDHIYEAPVLREKYGAKVYIGKHDAPLLENRTLYAPQNCMAYCENRKYPVDVLLEDGDEVNFSDYKFRVLELPGHTPGGIAFYGELFSAATFCFTAVAAEPILNSEMPMIWKSLCKDLRRLTPIPAFIPGMVLQLR